MPNLTENFDQLKRSSEIQSSECFPFISDFIQESCMFSHLREYSLSCFYLSFCQPLCLSVSLSLRVSVSLSVCFPSVNLSIHRCTVVGNPGGSFLLHFYVEVFQKSLQGVHEVPPSPLSPLPYVHLCVYLTTSPWLLLFVSPSDVKK